MVERAYWLAWSKIAGVGPVLLRRLEQHFGSLKKAWEVPPTALAEVEGFGRQTIDAVVRGRGAIEPEKFLQEHLQKNPNFWTPADAEYPRLLLETPNQPSVLYYRGKSDLQENLGVRPMVGIVGTREPSDYGKRWTRKISMAVARAGFTVVSGLAAGIDTEAHVGCLEAGGRTVAILGTGTDRVYPPRNHSLYEEILKQGAVWSEYAAGIGPERSHFPQRNRIIAGLCRAILVMEAPTKSGALITAHLANDFCRDVYALPGSLDNPNSLGCLGLLSKGAQLILGEGHLLQLLGGMPTVDTKIDATKSEINAGKQLSLFEAISPPPVPELPAELAGVLQAISTEPMLFDLIVEKVGAPASFVSSALLQLELMGLVSQLPGMRYQRC